MFRPRCIYRALVPRNYWEFMVLRGTRGLFYYPHVLSGGAFNYSTVGCTHESRYEIPIQFIDDLMPSVGLAA